MDKIYFIETPFNVGDIVEPILNDVGEQDNFYYVVISFLVYSVDEKDFVNNYSIGCSDKKGSVTYFKPCEIKISTQVAK